MRINKFKIFGYLGLGLAAVSAVGTAAGVASLVVNTDPRIFTAARVADASGRALDFGGNYLWNSEIAEQNKGFIDTNFKKERFTADEKQSELDECQCERWEEVSYWDIDRLKK